MAMPDRRERGIIRPMNRDRLRQAREKIPLTFQALSDATGIATSQLHRFETGDRVPRIHEVEAIAQALGVSVAYLVEETDLPVTPKRRELAFRRLEALSEADFETVDTLLTRLSGQNP